jgi:hypothetical protein
MWLSFAQRDRAYSPTRDYLANGVALVITVAAEVDAFRGTQLNRARGDALEQK